MNDKFLEIVVVRVVLHSLCCNDDVYHDWILPIVREGKKLQIAPFNKSLLYSIGSGWDEFSDAGCTVDEDIDGQCCVEHLRDRLEHCKSLEIPN